MPEPNVGAQSKDKIATKIALVTLAVGFALLLLFVGLLIRMPATLVDFVDIVAIAGGLLIVATSLAFYALTDRFVSREAKYRTQLFESNQTLQAVIEASPLAVVALDGTGSVRVWNRAAEAMFGYKADEVVGKPIPLLPEDKGAVDRFVKMRERAMRGEAFSGIEMRPRKSDGSFINANISLAPVRGAGGAITGVMMSILDMTQVRRTELALQESQRVLSTLLSNLPGMAYRCANDREWTMEFVSQGCYSLTGYLPEDLEQNRTISYNRVIHPDDRQRIHDEVDAALEAKRPFQLQYRIVTARGEVKHVWEQGQAVRTSQGGVVALEGFIIDVTERSRAEEEARARQRQVNTLLDSLPAYAFLKDVHSVYIAANDLFCKAVGCPKEEIAGKTDFDFFPKEMAEKYRGDDARVVSTGQPIYVEEEMVEPGRKFYVGTRKVPLRDDSGNVVGLIGVSFDLTERRQMLAALEESEERYRSLVEHSPDAIAVHSGGRFVYANQAALKLIGARGPEDVIGKSWDKFVHPEDMEAVRRRIQGIMGGAPEAVLMEEKFLRIDGTTVDVEVAAIPTTYQGERAVQVVVRDITQRKLAEEDRRRFEERLSALNFYGAELNAAQELGQVYELTLDAVERTISAEHSSFILVRGGFLMEEASRGDPSIKLHSLPLDGSQRGITVRVAKTGEPALVSDVSKDESYVEGVPGVRSELAVPVEVEDKVVAVLDVQSRAPGAYDQGDAQLLRILASHAATAISNIQKRKQVERTSGQLASLLASSGEIIRVSDMRERLRAITEAIRRLGWRRVVISVRDENMAIPSRDDLVTAGLTDEEREYLWKTTSTGEWWKGSFGPEYDRFKVGSFYYLPWSDPWVRERLANVGIPSHLPPEEMGDWSPEDLLYAPLRLPDGRIVGVVSVDDPVDGRRPTRESLAPMELFISQAAQSIENARLLQQLTKARNQIREYATNLEHMVEQRSQELAQAQGRLLTAERMAAIGEVAAQVGHDLRNPLTAINTNLFYLNKVLKKEGGGRKVNDTISSIQRSVNHANKIVADLLEYSRVAQLKKARVALEGLIRHSLSELIIPSNVRLRVEVQPDIYIDADTAKMMRVFQNLASNAIDAMPDGGELVISSQVSGGDVVITVSDTGQGIEEKNLDQLFTPFFTTKAKGLGLGLATCKRLVEAHGGKISATSKVGQGTTIVVALPSTKGD